MKRSEIFRFEPSQDSILVSDKIQFTCLRLNLPFGHDISIYRSRIQFTVQRFNLPFDHEISIYRPIFQFTIRYFNLPPDHEISIYHPTFQFRAWEIEIHVRVPPGVSIGREVAVFLNMVLYFLYF